MSINNINITITEPLLVCRGCLASSGEMKNMFEWNIAEDFYKLTNIQINKSDELSELICTNCEDVITKCRDFYAQCLQTDLILRNVKKKTSPEVEESVQENSVSSTINNNIVTINIKAPNMEGKIYLPCPYCSEKFQRKNDLLNHLHKHDKDLTLDIRFYCTYDMCVYNIDVVNDKYFAGRKNLNQHIFKVHKNKVISCSNCSLSFFNESDYDRHVSSCNFIYACQICNKEYKTNERLLVHLLRNHPELHKQYKSERKAEKRKQKEIHTDTCDSPKRSSATQTLLENIKNDVTLSWQPDKFGTKKDEISTQTMFEDSSIKLQNEDDSIFFSETVSLSDIQTQTIPLEFGLSRSDKETVTSQTQSPDLSMKETQTCLCLTKPFKCDNLFNSFCMTSTETQTLDFDNDLLSFNSTETQTCSDDMNRDL